MGKKVVTMGEIMLRLATPDYKRFVQSDSFGVLYGGAEAAVAVSLANYGVESFFVTKLPQNSIAEGALNHLRRYGVKTDYIIRGGNRMGIYFLENGASVRPANVIYDRTYSAISEADKDEFSFDEMFRDAAWFHFSGITPALSEKSRKLTEAALKSAKEHGVTVSVDLNYRKKLWSSEEAQKTMVKLMKYVDVCIGNEEDAEKALGFRPGKSNIVEGRLELDGYKDMIREMHERFKFKFIATTLRKSYSASENGWSALIYNGNEFYYSKEYDIRIVDRIGAGDSFCGGLIYSLINGENFKEALEFAVAASALKHTISGDINLVKFDEVEALSKK